MRSNIDSCHGGTIITQEICKSPLQGHEEVASDDVIMMIMMVIKVTNKNLAKSYWQSLHRNSLKAQFKQRINT